MIAGRLVRHAGASQGTRGLFAFAIVGLGCTLAFAGLYSAFRTVAGPIQANLGALSITMVANFLANRRFTFGDRTGRFRTEAFQYALVYLIGLLSSSALLALSIALASAPSAPVEMAFAIGSGLAATVIRFVLLSRWVFREHPSLADVSAPSGAR